MRFLLLIYDAALLGLFVLALPYFIAQKALRRRAYAPFAARYGRLADEVNPQKAPSIWLHAVSVGEVLAARGLLAALKQRFPGRRLVVSTTTVAGQELALRGLPGVDAVFYAPFDWPGPVRRAVDRVRPDLLVLMETELWPNLIHAAHRAGTRIAVVNGRLSPRSFPRYRAVHRLIEPFLAKVDLFLMQAAPHADRARAIGAPPNRVEVSGNLKYDVAEPVAFPEDLQRVLRAERGVWIAGSTVLGEEEHVLASFAALRRQSPAAQLVLAPRHPERFEAAAQLLGATGLSWIRRSGMGDARTNDVDALLLDSIGELAALYRLARVAFIGGSLVPRGGHNVLEAAAAGRAVIVGPHMENFQEIADEFISEGALIQVASAEALTSALLSLWSDEVRRMNIGERGQRLVARNRGALERTVEALAALVER